MDTHTLDKIEFDRVRQILAEHANCALGRGMVAKIKPVAREDLVRQWLRQVEEMIEANATIGVPPYGGVRDVREIVRSAVPPHLPEPAEFAMVAETLDATQRIVRWAARLNPAAAELREALSCWLSPTRPRRPSGLASPRHRSWFGTCQPPLHAPPVLVDVRFLTNPFFVPELKALDGEDTEIREFVLKTPDAASLIATYIDMIDFLLPLYEKEGKTQLNLAVGCTGGRHRSVVMARAFYDHIAARRRRVELIHRDIHQPQ